MYCKVCRDHRNIYKGKRSRFIEGTDNYRHGPILHHCTTEPHKKCLVAHSVRERPHLTPMARLLQEMNKQQLGRYTALFESAYWLAAESISFNKFESLCKRDAKIGVDIGDNYRNIAAVRTLIESIAHVIRQDTVRDLSTCRFFSTSADGSTDLSTTEQESVYARYVVNGVPVNKFIG